MNKFQILGSATFHIRATVKANTKEEAEAIFCYAWNMEDCSTDMIDFLVVECIETQSDNRKFPTLDVEWCRKEVTEELEND